jgi:hypothetical protein
MESFFSTFLLLLGIYFLVGFIFALLFAFVGVNRIDAGAKGAPTSFRLLLLPGSMAFWPYLLIKWIKA